MSSTSRTRCSGMRFDCARHSRWWYALRHAVHGLRVEQRADVLQGLVELPVVPPVDPHGAAGRRVQAEHHAHRRRLAAPFGPRKPVTTPGRTVKVRSSTAVFVPKRLVRPSISITHPRYGGAGPAATGGAHPNSGAPPPRTARPGTARAAPGGCPPWLPRAPGGFPGARTRHAQLPAARPLRRAARHGSCAAPRPHGPRRPPRYGLPDWPRQRTRTAPPAGQGSTGPRQAPGGWSAPPMPGPDFPPTHPVRTLPWPGPLPPGPAPRAYEGAYPSRVRAQPTSTGTASRSRPPAPPDPPALVAAARPGPAPRAHGGAYPPGSAPSRPRPAPPRVPARPRRLILPCPGRRRASRPGSACAWRRVPSRVRAGDLRMHRPRVPAARRERRPTGARPSRTGAVATGVRPHSQGVRTPRVPAVHAGPGGRHVRPRPVPPVPGCAAPTARTCARPGSPPVRMPGPPGSPPRPYGRPPRPYRRVPGHRATGPPGGRGTRGRRRAAVSSSGVRGGGRGPAGQGVGASAGLLGGHPAGDLVVARHVRGGDGRTRQRGPGISRTLVSWALIESRRFVSAASSRSIRCGSGRPSRSRRPRCPRPAAAPSPRSDGPGARVGTQLRPPQAQLLRPVLDLREPLRLRLTRRQVALRLLAPLREVRLEVGGRLRRLRPGLLEERVRSSRFDCASFCARHAAGLPRPAPSRRSVRPRPRPSPCGRRRRSPRRCAPAGPRPGELAVLLGGAARLLTQVLRLLLGQPEDLLDPGTEVGRTTARPRSPGPVRSAFRGAAPRCAFPEL